MNFIKKRIFSYILPMILTLILSSCTGSRQIAENNLNHNPKYSDKTLLVHYIDVGQGDCILVQINNKNLLIDAGPRDTTEKVISYLKNQGVKNLNYIIATHPHEDHIGGMSKIIKEFNVEEFYAPKKTVSTKTFENMIKSLNDKKLKINVAKSGINLDLGTEVSCNILAPVKNEYEDLNNYSAVVKITYGKNSFLFTGDAEKLSEQEMVKENLNLKSDVIKIGHHGSSSSSSKEFLDKVYPEIAVIMCGEGNDYGHPHKETITELNKRNITVYRTDKNKDILLISNGKEIVKEK